MARLTVEDCLQHVNNRYELVLLATKRARQIMSGAHSSMIEENNDKPTVIALREIADGQINDDNIDPHKDEEITDNAEILDTSFGNIERQAETSGIDATKT